MRLFQYWDTGEPPPDVAPLIEALRRDNPQYPHRLYDRDSAAWLIGKHFGPRHRRAFDACAVPAMQADYFRLCALLRYGGIYVDADGRSRQSLAGLLETDPRDVMFSLDDFFQTGVMVFRRPNHPFLAAFLNLATDNIEQRRFQNVYLATGSPVADAIRALLDPEWFASVFERCDEWDRGMRFGEQLESARTLIPVTPQLVDAFRSIRIATLEDLSSWIHMTRPAYKSTARDWRHWPGSIYADERDP